MFTHTCKHCGVSFESTASVRTFCTRTCGNTYQKITRTKIKVVSCLFCNNSFKQITTSQVYCSQQCSSDHRKRPALFDLQCTWCLSRFEGTNAQRVKFNKVGRTYCSKKCADKGRAFITYGPISDDLRKARLSAQQYQYRNFGKVISEYHEAHVLQILIKRELRDRNKNGKY